MNFIRVNMDNFSIKITGMVIDQLQVNLEVGGLPKVSFNINAIAFVNSLTREELNKLKQLMESVEDVCVKCDHLCKEYNNFFCDNCIENKGKENNFEPLRCN